MTRSPDESARDASLLIGADRPVEAERAASAALREHPRHTRLQYEHALALLKQGRADDATDTLRRALAHHRDDTNLLMLLAFALNYDARATPADVAAAHWRYGMGLRGVVGPAARIRPRDRSNHPLRVGLVSGDLFRHSVAYFLEPLLAALPRDRFEIIALSSTRASDDVTARLRALSHEWLDLASADQESFARVARERSLDLALDLSGLSSGHRQAALARRIAPVQASYLGYPHAPGTDTLDARLADEITDPPELPNLMGGRIVRLPAPFVCYAPPVPLPPIIERPRAHVAFGCFANMAKLNPPLLGAWSRVLRGVPGSRLVLKNPSLADPLLRAALHARFAAVGIDPDRVDLRPPAPSEREHFDAYNDVDVALDTFPYCGVTTTCESLAMGVPVVSHRGSSHAARTGAALLGAVGMGDWCADDPDGYVRGAIERASPRSLQERAALRDRLLASSLCNADRLARAFAEALDELATPK